VGLGFPIALSVLCEQIGFVCNTYIVRPKRGALGLAQRVSEATAKLASTLVRKSDPGVVVRADGRVDLMRCGVIPSSRRAMLLLCSVCSFCFRIYGLFLFIHQDAYIGKYLKRH